MSPYFEYFGIKIITSNDGYAKLSLPFKKELTNPYGMLHGGTIMTLADSAMAVAMSTRFAHPYYTRKLEIKFKSFIKDGFIIAEAKLTNQKKNIIFGKIKVRSNKAILIAEVNATFVVTN